ncbi:hypothetical protein BDR26DRAFT_863115, partial [Obelidium mucronatum]
MGRVSLRLGYLKTLCNINTCYVDLKRVPGDGEIFKLGSVHFVPVDPSLYTPYYKPPADLKGAFDMISAKFKDFEARHRRRSSILNTVISERVSVSASVPELKAALLKASSEYVDEAPVVDRHTVDVVEAPKSPMMEAPKMTALTSRLSILPKSLGALLGSTGAGEVGAVRAPGVPPSFEDIQREMAAVRAKANEEARLLEEEEERLMAVQAKERENRALRVEFERNVKESIAKMVKGEPKSVAATFDQPEELEPLEGELYQEENELSEDERGEFDDLSVIPSASNYEDVDSLVPASVEQQFAIAENAETYDIAMEDVDEVSEIEAVDRAATIKSNAAVEELQIGDTSYVQNGSNLAELTFADTIIEPTDSADYISSDLKDGEIVEVDLVTVEEQENLVIPSVQSAGAEVKSQDIVIDSIPYDDLPADVKDRKTIEVASIEVEDQENRITSVQNGIAVTEFEKHDTTFESIHADGYILTDAKDRKAVGADLIVPEEIPILPPPVCYSFLCNHSSANTNVCYSYNHNPPSVFAVVNEPAELAPKTSATVISTVDGIHLAPSAKLLSFAAAHKFEVQNEPSPAPTEKSAVDAVNEGASLEDALPKDEDVNAEYIVADFHEPKSEFLESVSSALTENTAIHSSSAVFVSDTLTEISKNDSPAELAFAEAYAIPPSTAQDYEDLPQAKSEVDIIDHKIAESQLVPSYPSVAIAEKATVARVPVRCYSFLCNHTSTNTNTCYSYNHNSPAATHADVADAPKVSTTTIVEPTVVMAATAVTAIAAFEFQDYIADATGHDLVEPTQTVEITKSVTLSQYEYLAAEEKERTPSPVPVLPVFVAEVTSISIDTVAESVSELETARQETISGEETVGELPSSITQVDDLAQLQDASLDQNIRSEGAWINESNREPLAPDHIQVTADQKDWDTTIVEVAVKSPIEAIAFDRVSNDIDDVADQYLGGEAASAKPVQVAVDVTNPLEQVYVTDSSLEAPIVDDIADAEDDTFDLGDYGAEEEDSSDFLDEILAEETTTATVEATEDIVSTAVDVEEKTDFKMDDFMSDAFEVDLNELVSLKSPVEARARVASLLKEPADA